MSKLKIELFRYGTLVFGKVIEMDEELRDKGTLATTDGEEEFSIFSNANPELRSSRLYIRGSSKDYDDDIFVNDFGSDVKAEQVCDDIKQLVNKINKENIEDKKSPIIQVEFDK